MLPEIGVDEPAALVRQRRSENFPVSLRVLPRELAEDLIAVYEVVRVIDELGDTAAGDRSALLTRLESQLATVYAGGQAGVPVLDRLARTLRRRKLEQHQFQLLIEANRMDQRIGRYADFDALVDYCRHSATPIGRLVLQLFDTDRPELAALSDQVCIALQVLEHCQDVGEDYRRGRIYLPQDELADFGVAETDLAGGRCAPQLRRLIGYQVERADRLLDPGVQLVRQLRGWARVAVAGYLAGGRATVAALRRCDGEVLAATPTPSRAQTGWIALNLLVRPAGFSR